MTKAVKLAEQKKEIGLVQSKILLWGERNKIQTSGNQIHYTGICYSGGFNQLDNIESEPFEIGYASGAGMLIKKEVFEKIEKIEHFKESEQKRADNLILHYQITSIYKVLLLLKPLSEVDLMNP